MSATHGRYRKNKFLVPATLVAAGLLTISIKPLYSLLSPASIDLKIQHAPVIMPAVYKVYGNENAMDGKYSLFKMLVTNNSNNVARDVEVGYDIPNYVERKTITKVPVLLPGQSVVVNCYPQFADKIVEKTTSSRETVNVYVKGSNIQTLEQKFAIDFKGRNEFIYSCIPADEIRTAGEYFDNMPLLSCFVTPEDPIIKYFTQKVQEKVLKGEAASVENKDAEGVRFLTGIYYATLVSHMVYSGTSGVPAKIDDVSSLIQSIRLPREVITGKTGLCIELALLYSSIMLNAGMDPIIFLVPGHAYPGFRMNGNYYALEATGIGGEGLGGSMSTEDAFKTGMKNLQVFFQQLSAGDDRYRIIDVRESIKKGAVAMELRDDSYLRQKVDEIAQAFDGGIRVNTNTQDKALNEQNRNGNKEDSGSDNGSGSDNQTQRSDRRYEGIVTFSYPANWQLHTGNEQYLPQLKHVIVNSNNTAFVQVYQFSGYQNIQEALSTVEEYVVAHGGSIKYRQSGTTNAGFQLFDGQTSISGQGLNWVAAFKTTANGVSGICAGANYSTGSQFKSVVLGIIHSLQ